MTQTRQTALVTGASTGIGAVYADRLAKRGHDLVLVARDQARLETLAARLRSETGRAIDLLPANLTDAVPLAAVEARLRDDARITLLINNAGVAAHGGFADGDVEELDALVRLNVLALTRLTAVAARSFLGRPDPAIVNISSLLAVTPELPFGAYAATKAYVLALSQSLQAELGPKGLYVQAVMPGAVRTEIWERSGRDLNALPAAMDVEALVDAALVGFDRRELVTLPPLQDLGLWDAFTAARQAIRPAAAKAQVASRYLTPPA